MKLRYTGQQPTSFTTFPYLGEVEPGEFEARDEDGRVLLLRTDIERADAPADSEPAVEPEPAAQPKPRKASTSKTAEPASADTAPTATT